MKQTIYTGLVIATTCFFCLSIKAQPYHITMDFIKEREEYREPFRLDLTSDKSLWIKTGKARLLEEKKKEGMYYLPVKFNKNDTDYVYKDFLDDKMFTRYVHCGYYRLKEKILSFDWQLIDSTATILGYSCKAAKTLFRGRNYIAFYTEEIPISNGPWKFHGLPGLILKISATDIDNFDLSKQQFESGMFSEFSFDITCVGLKMDEAAKPVSFDKFYKKKIEKNKQKFISSWEELVQLFNETLNKNVQLTITEERQEDDYVPGDGYSTHSMKGCHEIFNLAYQTTGIRIDY